MTVAIETPRLLLRPLTVDDVSERYLSWFHDDESRRYISTAESTRQLADLREYIRVRQGRSDVAFFGMFSRETGLHVGNIKFEPIEPSFKYAVMGILIGDSESRGKGLAVEALRATASWMKTNYDLTHIVLTVKPEHTQAIRAYAAAGFVIDVPPHFVPIDGVTTMVHWL